MILHLENSSHDCLTVACCRLKFLLYSSIKISLVGTLKCDAGTQRNRILFTKTIVDLC